MKKKFVITVIAVALAICLTVAGTLAYLMSKPPKIENVFTLGKVEITLTESENREDVIIPLNDIVKDPIVTLKAGSQPSYVFVELEKTGNVDNYVTYTVLTGSENWTQLSATLPNVYWRVGPDLTAETAEDIPYQVLTGKGTAEFAKGFVTAKDVTKFADGDEPYLNFYAGAIQSDNISDAATAWTQLAGADGTLTE